MSRNEMVQCPFDPNHKVCGARYQYHVIKCKAKFPELAKQQKICPYNARHRMSLEDYKDHLLKCPDKSVLFREIVKGRPVNEVVNRPHFGVVRAPIELEHDPQLEEEWGYSEVEGGDGAENVVSFDLNTGGSVSRAESVASVELRSTGGASGVGNPNERIYPYSTGIGRCKGLKKEDEEQPKCCGRAAFRHR